MDAGILVTSCHVRVSTVCILLGISLAYYLGFMHTHYAIIQYVTLHACRSNIAISPALCYGCCVAVSKCGSMYGRLWVVNDKHQQ